MCCRAARTLIVRELYDRNGRVGGAGRRLIVGSDVEKRRLGRGEIDSHLRGLLQSVKERLLSRLKLLLIEISCDITAPLLKGPIDSRLVLLPEVADLCVGSLFQF